MVGNFVTGDVDDTTHVNAYYSFTHTSPPTDAPMIDSEEFDDVNERAIRPRHLEERAYTLGGYYTGKLPKWKWMNIP